MVKSEEEEEDEGSTSNSPRPHDASVICPQERCRAFVDDDPPRGDEMVDGGAGCRVKEEDTMDGKVKSGAWEIVLSTVATVFALLMETFE